MRPWKQTVLGLGLGTLTGLALVLRILNRIGHSLSYDKVKSLETEIAFTAIANNNDTPDGIHLKPDLATGLAWDSYDANLETLDGKDTLHATVGICYQNAATGHDTYDRPITPKSGRNRRQLDTSGEQEINSETICSFGAVFEE